jgi:tRNA (adenine22-N1)-methyltransferase
MIRNRIKLSKRLNCIAKQVDIGSKVADIGSDHAFIPIFLLLNKVTDKVLITDISDGPVRVSKRNISKYAMENRVYYKTGSGLKVLNDDELDNVIIAGMGAELIISILSDSLDNAKRVKKLIIQPMSSHALVRRWLWENGFEISKECLVKDRNRIYTVMCAKYTGMNYNYKEYEAYTGVNIDRDRSLFHEYIENYLKYFTGKIKGLKNGKEKDENEIRSVNSIISVLQDIKNHKGKENL